MKNILFIDDEVNILRAFKRVFRNLEFECYYALNIKEALEVYIQLDHLDMLVTDIKMPYFDGVRVLKLFKEAAPDTIRVAMSGYASTTSITEAISKNLAKQYYHKPWINEELILSVRKMFLLEDKLKSYELFEVIQKFDGIKTIPKLFNEVNLSIQQDKSIEYIKHIIEQDPAITSNILRVANSAFYAAKTGDIQQAIMYIGLNNLKQIILGYELGHMKAHLFAKSEFIWSHSSRTNLIFQDLYVKYYQTKVPTIISAAGIVHDIGKIIMLQVYGNDYYNKILKLDLRDDILLDKESELFKINHSVIGGYFLNWWAFPVDIVEMTVYHHTPNDEDIANKKLVSLMCIASQIEKSTFDESDLNFLSALENLEINKSSLDEIIEKFKNKIT